MRILLFVGIFMLAGCGGKKEACLPAGPNCVDCHCKDGMCCCNGKCKKVCDCPECPCLKK